MMGFARARPILRASARKHISCPSVGVTKLREVLLAEFGGFAGAGGGADLLFAAQLDAADLAGNGFREVAEFEPAHALERGEAGAGARGGGGGGGGGGGERGRGGGGGGGRRGLGGKKGLGRRGAASGRAQ